MNHRSRIQRPPGPTGLVRLSGTIALLAVLNLTGPWCAVAAQTEPVRTAAEAKASEPAFAAFEKWVGGVLSAQSDKAAQSGEQPKGGPGAGHAVALSGKAASPAVRFEPLPVILGAPELPLVGGNSRQQGATWGAELNYQGLNASYVVLDAKGRERGLWPLSKPMPAGQRFRIRITTSFDAVVAIDQVLGAVWDSRRAGQLYPEPGQSVALKAGQTSILPVGPDQHFVMRGRAATERLVLHVRHAKATAASRSDQPAYRQETAAGSSYLQLVRAGRFPHIEQVLAMRQ